MPPMKSNHLCYLLVVAHIFFFQIYNIFQGSIFTVESKLQFCCHVKTMWEYSQNKQHSTRALQFFPVYQFLVGLSIPHESFIDSGAEALAASIAAVSKYGGARAGYRTLLDALIPASSVLEEVMSVHFPSLFSLPYLLLLTMIWLYRN